MEHNLYVGQINSLYYRTLSWELILSCHYEKNLIQIVVSRYCPEPLCTEVLAESTSGVCQAEGWGSSEEYYILKGRLFFSLFRAFSYLGTKEGEKRYVFSLKYWLFLKRPPSPQALETSNGLTEKSDLLWLKKLLSWKLLQAISS